MSDLSMDTSVSPRQSPQRKSPPKHLSEFYNYFGNSSTPDNNNSGMPSTTENYTSQGQSQGLKLTQKEPQNGSSHIIETSSVISDGVSNPTTYTEFPLLNKASHRPGSISNTVRSFNSSVTDLPLIVKTQDVNDTIECYQRLLNTSAKYREALELVANAASEFGNALEECARCKGSGVASDGLMNASGLHYLISNHQQILSKSIKTDFEQPIMNITKEFHQDYQINDKKFKDIINIKTKELRQKEIANYKLSKKKTRNILAYKSNLLNLASQLDEIDKLKHDHYELVFNNVQQSAVDILNQSVSIIKGESIIYDNISKKSTLIYDKLSNLSNKNIEPFQFEKADRNNLSLRKTTNSTNNSNAKETNNVTTNSSFNVSSYDTLQEEATATIQDFDLHIDDRDAFGDEITSSNKKSSTAYTESPINSGNSRDNSEVQDTSYETNQRLTEEGVTRSDVTEDPTGNEDEDNSDLERDESFSLPTPASKGNTSLSQGFANEWSLPS